MVTAFPELVAGNNSESTEGSEGLLSRCEGTTSGSISRQMCLKW